jgi:hypothetical protein
MIESTSASAADNQAGASAEPDGLVAKYRRDHQNPVNHFLHVGVGWPLAAASVVLLPFRPLWSIGLFLAAYAIMFAGHFLFEHNIPTVLKEPSTPFVVAGAVIRRLASGLVRIATPLRVR